MQKLLLELKVINDLLKMNNYFQRQSQGGWRWVDAPVISSTSSPQMLVNECERKETSLSCAGYDHNNCTNRTDRHLAWALLRIMRGVDVLAGEMNTTLS